MDDGTAATENPEYTKISLQKFLENPETWLYDCFMQDFGCSLSSSIRQEIVQAIKIKNNLDQKISYLKSLPDHQITNGESDQQKIIHMLEDLKT